MTIKVDGTNDKTTKTMITIEVDKIYSSRLIGGKLYKLIVSIKSVGDMLAKIERVGLLEDDVYIEFDELNKAT